MNHKKYKKQYFDAPRVDEKWLKKDFIDKPPAWVSSDMRDGNQSISKPMTKEQKMGFFKMLCKIGFKEIEIGFPAASDTDFETTRSIIEETPNDVVLQVLTQSRPDLVEKTFKAMQGVNDGIIHFYYPTSVVQREQVFQKAKKQTLQKCVDGAKMVKDAESKYNGNFRFEFSPESFTETEPEFALEVCNAVIDEINPTRKKKLIINLPATVERSTSLAFGRQIAFINQNLENRQNIILSVHPHNDRGTAVAAAEMAVLAGAERVEGTLFGNGERTGNLDLINMALNCFSQGVDPKLDFSNMPDIIDFYEKTTGMTVHARHPYAGKNVFKAYSGSHQDAIVKSFDFRKKFPQKYWNVPYIVIDPSDIGLNSEKDIICINSQSGKGGVDYVLRQYGIQLERDELIKFASVIKQIADKEARELPYDEVKEAFNSRK